MGHQLSTNILTYLNEKGFTNRKIANIVGVHPSEISRINAGIRKFTLTQLERLAIYFNTPLSIFILDAIRDQDNYRMTPELRYHLAKVIEELDKSKTTPPPCICRRNSFGKIIITTTGCQIHGKAQ